MSSEHPTRQDGSLPDPDPAEVARLLRLAGPRPPVPEDRAARVRSAVHAAWRHDVDTHAGRAQWIRGRWIRGTVALAAVLLAAVGLAVLRPWRSAETPIVATVERTAEGLRGRGPGDDISLATGSAVVAGTSLETDPDVRAALRLTTGASLRLAGGTRVRLEAPTVLVLDRGEIYLDSPDGGGQHAIRTPFGTVRDVGTRFEVGLTAETLRVRVRQGVVAVGDVPGEVRAGEELTVDTDGHVTKTAVPVHGPEWDWVVASAPAFELEGRTLRQLLDWAVRETGWSLRYADDAIAAKAASTVLHGAALEVPPDQAPALVLPTCGLRSRLEDGVLVVEAP